MPKLQIGTCSVDYITYFRQGSYYSKGQRYCYCCCFVTRFHDINKGLPFLIVSIFVMPLLVLTLFMSNVSIVIS